MNHLPDHRCDNTAMHLHSRRGIVIALASAAVLSSPSALIAAEGSPEDQQFMRMAIDEARQGDQYPAAYLEIDLRGVPGAAR